MDRRVRLVVGVVTPIVALWLANWVDDTFVHDARQNAGRSYDLQGELIATNAGLFATAMLTLAVAFVALWSRSRLVAGMYIVLGGFYGLLFALTAILAVRVNDAPPFGPEPLATFLTSRFTEIDMGSIGSVLIVGSAMLIAGVAALIGSYRPVAPTEATSD